MFTDAIRLKGSIDHLYRDALKMNPLQDLSFQTVSFSGTTVARLWFQLGSECHDPLQEPSFLIAF